ARRDNDGTCCINQAPPNSTAVQNKSPSTVLSRNGSAAMKHCVKPCHVSGYMPLNAQTAKFVATKKISEHDNVAAITGTAPGQRRISMPANAGRVIAAQTTSVIRQSSPASATLLSNTAASGTTTASRSEERRVGRECRCRWP